MEFIRLLAAGGAGCVIGFGIGYLIGSDNGFVKGSHWATGNMRELKRQVEKEEQYN